MTELANHPRPFNERGDWDIRMHDDLHMREKALVRAFHRVNQHIPSMIAYRLNYLEEYEGRMEGFVAEINELMKHPDNPALWIHMGFMSSGGNDYVVRYEPVTLEDRATGEIGNERTWGSTLKRFIPRL